MATVIVVEQITCPDGSVDKYGPFNFSNTDAEWLEELETLLNNEVGTSDVMTVTGLTATLNCQDGRIHTIRILTDESGTGLGNADPFVSGQGHSRTSGQRKI